jgi:hypothetical protein
MARRPSTVSVISFGSIKGLADVSNPAPAPSFASSPSALKFTRSIPLTHSSSAQSVRTPDEAASIDPDELFAKYTIAEVKAKQVQLRCALPVSAIAQAHKETSDLMQRPSRRIFVLWLGACSCAKCVSPFDCTLKAQGTVPRSPASLNVHNLNV